MVTKCPQCGATFESGESCRERFSATQGKEIEHSASYDAVHHLSVLSYMLQHNAYSRDGWLAARQLLHQFVYEGLTPAEVRRRYRLDWDDEQRAWSFTKGAKLTQVDEIVWTRTIVDVRTDTAEHYCADVRDWAVAVLADTEVLVQAPG
jgi:hypothetical protein